MACRFEVVLPGERAGHVTHACAALDEADRLEALLTVFRETSELARINRTAAGVARNVDPAVLEILRRSRELHARTEGAFDVTSTPLSRCWGFLRREGRVPPEDAIAAARRLVGMQHVEIDPATMSVRFARAGMELNLGSIGKGYALDCMGDLLRRLGVRRALLSAGGSSILAVGSDGPGWPINLRPRLVQQVSGERGMRVHLRDAALATSGAGEQFVEADGRRYGHVIDPRTAWPASGVLSASVITANAADADALSTAFLVGGPGLASRYCAAHGGTLVLMALEGEGGRFRRFGACAHADLEES